MDLGLNGQDLEEMFANADKSLEDNLPECFASLPPHAVDSIARAILRRNGLVVDINPVVSALVECNTSVNPLGGLEHAKATIFYLTKYLCKDGIALSNSLAVLRSAKLHIDKYPSVAADSGSTSRTGSHFLTLVVNCLSAQSEVSATQAAASELGMEAQIFSHDFVSVYIHPAMEHVISECAKLGMNEEQTLGTC